MIERYERLSFKQFKEILEKYKTNIYYDYESVREHVIDYDIKISASAVYKANSFISRQDGTFIEWDKVIDSCEKLNITKLLGTSDNNACVVIDLDSINPFGFPIYKCCYLKELKNFKFEIKKTTKIFNCLYKPKELIKETIEE